MKIVQINSTYASGSTGKICLAISNLLSENSIENYVFYTHGNTDAKCGIKYSGDIYRKIQALKSRLFGNYGFNSDGATYKLLSALNKIQPDIVHIHNIHGHDCNLEILLNYLKKKQIKVFWTFHDCWAFTGYCTHFTMAKCDKWLTRCDNCIQRTTYSWFCDKSGILQDKKKALLSDIDLTIITPSKWLADLVKQSFLKQYTVKVINNGIDLNVFKPRKSDFRAKYGIPEKQKIILGVAFDWGINKGLDIFVRLSEELAKNYTIVLVGTNEAVDKQIPKNIVTVHRTKSQLELAEIYSVADVFANPTREDNYPTVNMEALACGCRVVTFDTGGCPEIVTDTVGAVTPCDDYNAFQDAIISECARTRTNAVNDIVLRFDQNRCFKNIVEMYSSTDIT